MSETTPETPHRIQQLITRTLPPLGALIGLATSLLAIFSLVLVVASAFEISQLLGVVTLVGVISAYVIAALLSDSPKRRITYKLGNEVKPVSQATSAYILLVVCGFIQTLFWVHYPANPIHEPRSVFILAVAGFIEYYRRQYEKSQAKA
jgi:uncharacterized membrane protein YciS (DUF1049 family)